MLANTKYKLGDRNIDLVSNFFYARNGYPYGLTALVWFGSAGWFVGCPRGGILTRYGHGHLCSEFAAQLSPDYGV